MSFFLFEKLFSYIATDSISPVGNGHRKLFVGEKQTTWWKNRDKLSDIRGVKQLKNTFSPSAPVSNSSKTDGQVTTSLSETSLWVPKATSAGLTWLLGILNPGFYFCWAGLRGDGACCPLLWVLHLGHGEVRHCSNRPLQSLLFQRLNFLPVFPCLPPHSDHSLGRQWLGIGKY